jgi:hypothetical protein
VVNSDTPRRNGIRLSLGRVAACGIRILAGEGAVQLLRLNVLERAHHILEVQNPAGEITKQWNTGSLDILD